MLDLWSEKLIASGGGIDPSIVDVPVNFSYTGAVQTYIVPDGCKKLKVDCVGAAGGTYKAATPGGAGGRVECVLSVKPKDILFLYIGGIGSASAGWNGGGLRKKTGSTEYKDSGGGSSDIRTVEATSGSWYDTAHSSWDADASLLSRLVVAGGGGGMSQNSKGAPGGGLEGGVLNGGQGTPCTPATQTSGGTGAKVFSPGAGNGVFGKGGDGVMPTSGSGAGGGGGWYGGGGGQYYQPGGGGSSYTHPDRCSGVVHTQGYSGGTGNGYIILTPVK